MCVLGRGFGGVPFVAYVDLCGVYFKIKGGLNGRPVFRQASKRDNGSQTRQLWIFNSDSDGSWLVSDSLRGDRADEGHCLAWGNDPNGGCDASLAPSGIALHVPYTAKKCSPHFQVYCALSYFQWVVAWHVRVASLFAIGCS